MAFIQSMLYLITFTCFLHLTKPSNLITDMLSQGHQLTTTDRLISSGGWYTLNFSQYQDSEDFYLGINSLNDNSSYGYFWIANRDMPIRDGFLTIDQHGNLKIISNDGNSTIMLYSYQADQSNNKSTISAILEDSGNFMLREMNQDGSMKRILWESFDHPTAAIISGMKLGFDRKTGQNWSITSWRRSDKFPLSGSITLGLDPKTSQ